MHRRTLLITSAALWATGCASTPDRAAPRATDASPSRAALDAAWLDRLTWGASTTSLAELRRTGRAAWLEAQLQAQGASPPEVQAQGALRPEVQAQIDRLGMAWRDLPALVRDLEAQRRQADTLPDEDARVAARQAHQQALNRLARDAAGRALLLAVYSPNQVQEQLTWFWFNHFNVHQHKHNLRAMVGDYEQGLRERALGRFRDLLGFATSHPAMLRYLDNEQNAANHLNENHARELMELHTLGVDAGYTQRDVQELARVLTGWGVNLTGEEPRLRPALQGQVVRRGLTLFNPARHDFGDKAWLGQTVRGQGAAELDKVLDALARHPATARHVSGKLAQAFVGDAPAPALVDRLAHRWQETDGSVAELMRTLVASREFEASLGRQFKDPQHYVVSAVRLAYDTKPILNTAPLVNWLNRLGQAPYNRQTPDGYPQDEAAWSGPGQMNTRFEIARAIASGSAGLFRVDGENAERPAFAQLANPLYFEGIAPRLSSATRQAMDQAGSPQEWGTLLLASPEFMHR